MNPLEEAVGEIASFLELKRIPYMVIGGVANLVWGFPRSTGDVDVTVWIEESRTPAFVADLVQTFPALVEDPVSFAATARVLPVRTETGLRIDVALGALPFEKTAIDRAPVRRIGRREVRVCAPEDLVLHKLASERDRDREDVRGILRKQGRKLDRAYLDPRVEQLARDLERPAILEFFRKCLPAR